MEYAVYFSVVGGAELLPDRRIVLFNGVYYALSERLDISFCGKILHKTGLRQCCNIRRRTGFCLNLNLSLELRASFIYDIIAALFIEDFDDFFKAGCFFTAVCAEYKDCFVCGVCFFTCSRFCFLRTSDDRWQQGSATQTDKG